MEPTVNDITLLDISPDQIPTQTWDQLVLQNAEATQRGSGISVIGKPFQSPNFISGETGWRIDSNGKAEFQSVVIDGVALSNIGTFGGDGSDGALAITSGTTTINCAGSQIVIKNYTSISITGSGKLAFSNPHASGTVVILKSQGDVTITSSTAPCIDAVGLGASGGVGGDRATGGGATTGTAGTDGTNLITTWNTDEGETAASGGSVGGSGGIAVSNSNLYQSTSVYLHLQGRYPTVFVGAGGGGGGCNASTGNTGTGHAGDAGRGGGGLVIECAGAWNFTTASGISAAGEPGDAGQILTTGATPKLGVGGGGGGGGGFVFALYNTLTANSGTVSVAGGTGGAGADNWSASDTGGGGGGGGGSVAAGSGGVSGGVMTSGAGGAGGAGVSFVTQNVFFA